jgi:hypothetical protein
MLLQLDQTVCRSLRALAFALDKFEPFVAFAVPARVLQHLVEEDLAEVGPSARPAVGSIGYRLTGRGWETVRKVWTR